MPSDRNGDSSADTLNGWKEISAFLGKSVRTAQRWERELGLPTRRIKTPDGQIVFGKRSEIEAWRSSLDQRQLGLVEEAADEETDGGQAPVPDVAVAARGRTRSRPIAWVALALVVMAAGSLAAWKLQARFRPLDPTTLRFVGRELQAIGPTGNVAWTYQFGTDVGPVLSEAVNVARTDINNDGELEDLVPVRYGRPRERMTSKGDALMAFSNRGRLLWTAASDRTVQCGGETWGGPWAISSILVSHDSTPARVWVAFFHHTWWPSFVVEILPDGTQVPRYFQAGWIMSLAEWQTPSGRWGVAGGVMNEPSRGSVALFNLDGDEQVLPAVDPKFACSPGAAQAKPQRVVLLPNFEVPQATDNAYIIVQDLRAVGDGLRVSTNAGPFAMVAADGTVTDLAASDAYWFAHGELEGVHRLTHTMASCPDLLKPKEIRYWTASSGWRTSSIMMKNHRSAAAR